MAPVTMFIPTDWRGVPIEEFYRRMGLNVPSADEMWVRNQVAEGWIPDYHANKLKALLEVEADPDTAIAKLNSSSYLSVQTGLPIETVLANYDDVSLSYWGRRASPLSDFDAIKDSLEAGWKNYRLGLLYARARDRGWTPELQDEIRQWEESMPGIDRIKRGLGAEMLKGAAQSATYSAVSGAGSILATAATTALGMFIPPAGIAMAAISAVARAAGMYATAKSQGGLEYKELLDAGMNERAAATGSLISGWVQALIEEDQFKGLFTSSRLWKSLSGKIFETVNDKLVKGAFRYPLLAVAGRYGARLLGEGVEEGMQTAASSLVREVVREVSNTRDGKELPPQTWGEIGSAIKDSIVQGALASIPLGALAEPFMMAEDFRAAKLAKAISDAKPEEAKTKKAEDVLAAGKAVASTGAGTAEATVQVLTGAKSPLRFTDTEVAPGLMRTAGTAQTTGKRREGTVAAEYSLDEEAQTLEIANTFLDKKLAGKDREEARGQLADLFRHIRQTYQGYDIQWDPKGKESASIKTALEAESPGFFSKEYKPQITAERLRSQVQTIFKPGSSVESDVIMDILARREAKKAKAEGRKADLGAYVAATFDESGIARGLEELPEERRAALGEIIGSNPRAAGMTYFVDKRTGELVFDPQQVATAREHMRAAVLLLPKKSTDAGTLLHELTHVLAVMDLDQDEKAALEEHFGKKYEEFSVKEHDDLAYGSLKFLRSGVFEGPPGLKSVFMKLADLFRSIIKRAREAKIKISPALQRFYSQVLLGSEAGKESMKWDIDSQALLDEQAAMKPAKTGKTVQTAVPAVEATATMAKAAETADEEVALADKEDEQAAQLLEEEDNLDVVLAPSPKATNVGYKLFDYYDGKLYPLFIGAKDPTPQGVWLAARNLPTAGFARRPGWHLGADTPDAPWLKSQDGKYWSKRKINGKKVERVWAEVEYPADRDYQPEADASPTKDLKDTIPQGGYYLFKEGARGTWVVAGAIKVNRVIGEEERQQILKEKGYDEGAAYAPYQRKFEKRRTTLEAKKAGEEILFEEAGDITSPEFQEWFGHSKAVNEDGSPRILYHGTMSEEGIEAFDKGALGRNTGAGSAKLGFFFAGKIDTAKSYQKSKPSDTFEALNNEASRELYPILQSLAQLGDRDAEYYIDVIDNNGYVINTDQYGFNAENGISDLYDIVDDFIEKYQDENDDGESLAAPRRLLDLRDRLGNMDYSAGADRQILQVYLRIENPLIYDQGGKTYREKTFRDIILRAIDEGRDGVIIKNTYDGGPLDDIFVVFDPNQAKSVYNGGAWSRSDDRILFEDDFELGTRAPTSKKPGDDSANPDTLLSYRMIIDDPKLAKKAADSIAEYPNSRSMPGDSPTQIIEAFIEHATENLIALHDMVDPKTRDRAKLWYDGARKVAERWSARYGITRSQAAGVLAALSPQKDWFENVSIAERVLDVCTAQSVYWSPEMDAAIQTLDVIQRNPDLAVRANAIAGKSFSEIDDNLDRAIFIRLYHDANSEKTYRVVTPEGDFGRKATSPSGAEASIRWNDFSSIGKAVSIAMDGSKANISAAIGFQHKVRNFYNNIIAPRSSRGHVTIDTHAVAASLFRPLSGESREVAHNFGGSYPGAKNPGQSSVLGLSGTYAIYAEAYRRAAEARGLLPREMQSITWEAVRAMLSPAFKRNKKATGKIDEIFLQYKTGVINGAEARRLVVEAAGGMGTPEWARPGAALDDQTWDTSYEGAISGDKIPRGLQTGLGAGGVNTTASVAPGDDPGYGKVLFEISDRVRKFAKKHTGWSETSQQVWDMLDILDDLDSRVSQLVSDQRATGPELTRLFANDSKKRNVWAAYVPKVETLLGVPLPAFDAQGNVPDETVRIIREAKDAKLLTKTIKGKIGGLIAGHGRYNAYEINKVLASDADLRKEIQAIQDRINELFGATPIIDSDGIVTLGIERRLGTYANRKLNIDKPKFGGFARAFSQTFIDFLPDDVFETFRGELTRAVEYGFKGKPSGLKGVRFLDKPIDSVGKSQFSRLATTLKKAEKTVAALNLNSACPMFMIGSHGCYFDGCYVTGMGMGGTTISFYQRAAYTGEILQLGQEDIDLINSVGGLRMNGMGDLTWRQYGQFSDVVRHAEMRGLKLKIITKQDATVQMLIKMAQEGQSLAGVQVQLSLDPYWIPIHDDDLVDSFSSNMGLAKSLAANPNDQEIIDAIISLYQSQGRDAKVIDGTLYRKYGWDLQRALAVQSEASDVGLDILLRVVVGTPKEIVWYARNHPEMLQTWMHAAIRPGMYSDVEGRVLKKGDVGNFTMRIAIYKGDSEWNLKALTAKPKFRTLSGTKGSGSEVYYLTKQIRDAKAAGDTALAQELEARRASVVSKGAADVGSKDRKAYKATEEYIKIQPDAEAIFKVLAGSLASNPSSLCCAAGADADACNNCTSHCHQGSSGWQQGAPVQVAAAKTVLANMIQTAAGLNASLAETTADGQGEPQDVQAQVLLEETGDGLSAEASEFETYEEFRDTYLMEGEDEEQLKDAWAAKAGDPIPGAQADREFASRIRADPVALEAVLDAIGTKLLADGRTTKTRKGLSITEAAAVRVAEGKPLSPAEAARVVRQISASPRKIRERFAQLSGNTQMLSQIAAEDAGEAPEDDFSIDVPKQLQHNIISASIKHRAALAKLDPAMQASLKKQEMKYKQALSTERAYREETVVLENELENYRARYESFRKAFSFAERRIADEQKTFRAIQKELASEKAKKRAAAKLGTPYDDAIIADLEQRQEAMEKSIRAMIAALPNGTTMRTAEYLTTKKAVADTRKKLEDKYAEAEARRAEKNLILSLAKAIRAPVVKRTDWKIAVKIKAIQDAINPKFLKPIAGVDLAELRRVFLDNVKFDGLLSKGLIDRIKRKSLDEWTSSELRDLKDEVDALREQGKRLYEEKIAALRQARATASSGMISALEASGKYQEQPRVGSVEYRKWQKLENSVVRKFALSLETIHRITRTLDNDQDSGFFQRELVEKERAAFTAEKDAYDSRWGNIEKKIKELGLNVETMYGKHIKVGEHTFTRWDLIGMYIGMQNRRTREAIVYGVMMSQRQRTTLSDEDLQILAGSITADIDDAIQDLSTQERELAAYLIQDGAVNFDRFAEAIYQAENRMPEREAIYFPHERKARSGEGEMIEEIVDQALNGIAKAERGVGKGPTINRIEIGNRHQMPISLDAYGVYRRGIERQEHYIAYAKWVQQTNLLIKNGRTAADLRYMIIQTHGGNYLDYLDRWIAEAANPRAFTDFNKPASGADSALRAMRGPLGIAYLGLRASSAFKQLVTSPIPYLPYAGPHMVARMVQNLNPAEFMKVLKFARENSAFILDRVALPSQEWLRAAGEAGPAGRSIQKAGSVALKMIEWADMWSVATGWMATYEKTRADLSKQGGLDEDAIHAQAVAEADKVTQQSQPTSRPQDLAPLFKEDKEIYKILLQFQGPLNVVYNQLFRDVPADFRSGHAGRALAIISGYLSVGALLALLRAPRDDDDDDTKKWKQVLTGMLSQPLEAIPFVGRYASNLASKVIAGESGYQPSDPFPGIQQATDGAARVISGMDAQDREKIQKGLSQFAKGTAMLLGVPTSALDEYYRAFVEGDLGALIGKQRTSK